MITETTKDNSNVTFNEFEEFSIDTNKVPKKILSINEVL